PEPAAAPTPAPDSSAPPAEPEVAPLRSPSPSPVSLPSPVVPVVAAPPAIAPAPPALAPAPTAQPQAPVDTSPGAQPSAAQPDASSSTVSGLLGEGQPGSSDTSVSAPPSLSAETSLSAPPSPSDTSTSSQPLPQLAPAPKQGRLATSGYTVIPLGNGEELVAGGMVDGSPSAVAQIHDLASDTWTTTGYMTSPRSGESAALLSNGTVLVVGGNAGGTSL